MWFGLVAGILETGVLVANRELLRRVVLDWLRLNRHALWMIVVVTADHGESLGEHDLCNHGRSLYEPEVHVPLLIIAPRIIPAGRRVAAPVTVRDVAVPRPLSLSRHWQEGSAAGELRKGPILTEVFSRTTQGGAASLAPALKGPVRAVVLGTRKYIWNGDGTEEFYNLADDPAESRNIANSTDLHAYREILRRAWTLGGKRDSPSTKNY